MTNFRKTVALLVSILIALMLCGCGSDSEGYPKPTEKFFVNDFAEVISSADENTIYNHAVTLYDKTDAQVVVVTVNSLNGEAIADYALNLGREWGVGSEEENNGIVILLSVEEREIYIAVGYGLEGALPDSKTGRIIDNYGIAYFAQDEFSKGLVSISDAIVNEVYIEYGLEYDADYTPINELSEQEVQVSSGKVAASWALMIISEYSKSYYI